MKMVSYNAYFKSTVGMARDRIDTRTGREIT